MKKKIKSNLMKIETGPKLTKSDNMHISEAIQARL